MPDPTGRVSHLPDMHRGVSWKQPVRVATTANITISTALNNGDTIDGVTLATDDRVLVKDQSTASQNGIYIVGATPVRAFDMDQDGSTSVPAEEVMGALVYVITGTTNGGKVFRCTNTSAPTIGSTSLAFTQYPATATGTLLGVLGWYDAIVDGGLVGDGSTDDTTALTNLIATATASGTKSATIYFPGDHVYKLAGNVTFPAVSLSNPQITIEFVGARRPPFQPNGSIPNAAGYSILRGTATTGTATINGGTSPTNNNIVINIRNLLCIANDNPTITFWNLEMTYSGIIEGLMISVTPWTTAPTYPTHSSVYGVTLPQNLHSNGQQIDGLQIGGFYTCIKLGELERGRNLIFGNCRIGMESNSASHSGFIESLQITNYTYGLYSTGTRYLDILNFDTERGSGSFATTADIYDPGDDIYGYVRWFEVTAGVGPQHLFTVTGGANLLTEEIGPSWGGGAPTGADYLVGTAQAGLSAEIVVGTTPGGELGGTWASPTVDATHAGSTHIALSSATPLADSGAGSAGSGTAASKDDHVHPASATGEILVSDTPAGSPLIFSDLLQNEAGTDLLYAG